MLCKRLMMAVVFCTLAACQPPEQSDSEVKIVGGATADESDLVARSTFALMANGEQFCSATLIGPKHLVTAAHCLTGAAPEFKTIQIGTGIKAKPVKGLKPKSFALHPDYDTKQDIGVLTFSGKLPPGLEPVDIAADKALKRGVEIIAAGYGITETNSDDGGTLRKVKLETARVIKGRREFTIRKNQGIGTCSGDSGGPAFLVADGKLQVAGVVSRGRVDCNKGDSIYTDVRVYQGWMKCSFAAMGAPLSKLLDDDSVKDCK